MSSQRNDKLQCKVDEVECNVTEAGHCLRHKVNLSRHKGVLWYHIKHLESFLHVRLDKHKRAVCDD